MFVHAFFFRNSRRTPDSPSAELTHLLNQIITTAEAASSSSGGSSSSALQTESMLDNERKAASTGPGRVPSVEEAEPADKMQEEEKDSKTGKAGELNFH